MAIGLDGLRPPLHVNDKTAWLLRALNSRIAKPWLSTCTVARISVSGRGSRGSSMRPRANLPVTSNFHRSAAAGS